MILAVEEFKNDLYIVAGSGGWFGGEQLPGRVFRSPDGKNWEPVTEPGFGLGSIEDVCGENYYDLSWDMAVFKGKLYLTAHDSCGTRPGIILRSSDGKNWENVADAESLGAVYYFGEAYPFYGSFHKFAVYNGMLYANLENYDSDNSICAGKVYRSLSGDPGTWVEAANFSDACFLGSFQTFKGGLYLASDGIYDPEWNTLSDKVYRTFDGVNWEMVANGFGNDLATLGAFADYKGYLYVGAGTYAGEGGQIWRTKDGVTWEPVMTGGFGNPLNEKIDGLIAYAGDLYAYTVNWVEGASVFRTADAINWEPANEPGWGNPTYYATHHSSGQAVFKDELYMGTLGPQGVLLKMLHPDK